jgi:hypothetical protein
VIRRLPVGLLLIAASAGAQEMTGAHMEGCLVWNRGGNVSVRNECSRPLALMFMDFDQQQVATADVAPGARFTSDAVWGQSSGFMFTACPVGSAPSVRFALENKETIGVSLYNCVVGRPSS